MEKGVNGHKTNVADVLIALINGIFNLLKVEKVICIGILYFLGRDAYFASKAKEYEQIRDLMLTKDFFDAIIKNDNLMIIILATLIVVLLVVILIQIFVVQRFYKKEIDRLSEIRKELMHDRNSDNFTPLNKHHSTKRE